MISQRKQSAYDAAHARSTYIIYGQAGFNQYFQNADMSKAFGSSATQHKANFGRICLIFVLSFNGKRGKLKKNDQKNG